MKNIQHILTGLICCLLTITACQKSVIYPDNQDKFNTLEFNVFSKAPGTETPQIGWNADEFGIRELYIYAFSDTQKRPDFFQDTYINLQQGVTKNYKVNMRINSLGEKRFYIIANPPAYIRKKLTYDCTEGELKTMSIALQKPLEDVKKLPQEADGISKPSNSGFPMSTQFTAFVKEGKLKGELLLTSSANPTDGTITQIPIFRSLGKVTVTIHKKEAIQEAVFIKELRIFNYTCNGNFLPMWQSNIPTWDSVSGGWNRNIHFDLLKMSELETKVGVEPVSLLQKDITVDSVTPQTLTSFYVCQNSYGKAMASDPIPGVEDVVGNRTTKLALSLSDGRQSVIDLPYLRRNDHLKISIVIGKNIIQAIFMPWVLDEVTPEWGDGIL